MCRESVCRSIYAGVIVLAITLSASTANGAASPKSLVIAADLWCPYNCLPESTLPGYMVELTQHAFDAVSPGQYHVIYKILTWKRAILQARNGYIDGIIGAVPSEAEQLHFPSEEQGLMIDRFFTRKDSSWSFQGVSELTHQSAFILGGVDGYAYTKGVSRFMKSFPRQAYLASGANAMRKLVDLLDLGRIDAIVGNENVFRFAVRARPNGFQNYRIAGSTNVEEKLYVAFNQAILAQQLAEGTRLIRANGTLETILERYGLADWK